MTMQYRTAFFALCAFLVATTASSFQTRTRETCLVCRLIGWIRHCNCCTSNEHCPGPSVCNDFGFCTQCLSEQEGCRRDDDCCSQLICSASRCRLPKKPGRPGARCSRHQDCNRGLCCAKDKDSEGHVCKQLGSVGSYCSMSGSVEEYDCPCRSGYKCQGRETEFWKSFYSRFFVKGDVRLCALHIFPEPDDLSGSGSLITEPPSVNHTLTRKEKKLLERERKKKEREKEREIKRLETKKRKEQMRLKRLEEKERRRQEKLLRELTTIEAPTDSTDPSTESISPTDDVGSGGSMAELPSIELSPNRTLSRKEKNILERERQKKEREKEREIKRLETKKRKELMRLKRLEEKERRQYEKLLSELPTIETPTLPQEERERLRQIEEKEKNRQEKLERKEGT